MNRNTLIALLAAAVLWSTPATSALRNVENAYELEAGNVLLPDGDSGQAILRPCVTCKSVVLKIDAGTTYRVGTGSNPLGLAKFRTLLQKNEHKLLVVIYRLDTKVVTHMVLAN